MADMDKFIEINQNFDTVKTLLNSIRAQGILNTSDVDKLLSGINAKLEKINTEEDIDLIKIFLSELKQNLDERHSILVSKFGAIESLFSSLLKNSAEMPKSADVKEFFDIIATNLSVFSKEVVSQKEALTDISLRLDAMRSDDSLKKDIIKNISLLKSDLERVNNGFDSIVLSLNDNFKTVVKTISSLDKTSEFESFSSILNNIELSSNTLLSAIQMLDKKAEQVDDSLQNLATKDDIATSSKRLFELTAQSHELTAAVSNLSEKYIRVDNLADKIDASVNIIATLKSVLEEKDDKNTTVVIEQLKGLEDKLDTISSDDKFDRFKLELESVLKNVLESIELSNDGISIASQEIKNIVAYIEALDIKVNFQNLASSIVKVETDIKTSINEVSQKLLNLYDANVTRVLNDISQNAESIGAKLNQTQSAMAVLCEKHFGSVFENIIELKNTLAQIDENSISANNAIFSSITDRLTIFENDLKNSLETQEITVNNSSAQIVAQIENIKNLTSVLDYKMDSSVVEVSNIKREFSDLQTAINDILALDFVNVVKDLRVDLYASKQELSNSFDSNKTEVVESLISEFYNKYELLIQKINSTEDILVKAQADSLKDLKFILENISASIVDVLTYVGDSNFSRDTDLEGKIGELATVIGENCFNYIQNVKETVDDFNKVVTEGLNNILENNKTHFDSIKNSISQNSEDIRKEIKFSYSKILEIQDIQNEIKEILNINEVNSSSKLDRFISSAEEVKSDFGNNLSALKTTLLEKITEFKQEFTCENADKVNELKYSVESVYNKNSKEVTELLDGLRLDFKTLTAETDTNRMNAVAEIMDKFDSIKALIEQIKTESADNLAENVNSILIDITNVKDVLNKVDESIDSDLTRQLSIIESNFESLVSQINIIFDKSNLSLTDKINEEFTSISEKMQEIVSTKLEGYKLQIENTFNNIEAQSKVTSSELQDKIEDLNNKLKDAIATQAEENNTHLDLIAKNLRSVLDENIKLTSVDYVALKNSLADYSKSVENNNKILTQDIKAQLDDITKYIDSVIELQTQETMAKNEELAKLVTSSADNISNIIDSVKTLAENNQSDLLQNLSQITETTISNFKELEEQFDNKISDIKALTAEVSAGELQALDSYVQTLLEQFELQKQQVQLTKDFIATAFKKEIEIVSQNIEKETDVIIAEIIEQFDLLKKSQADDVVNLTSRIEEIVNAHIYNNIEDLKSYLDIKTDNSVLSSKLDNIKIEMISSFENTIENLNKLLDINLFNSSIKEYRVANELLINTSVDKINSQIEDFVSKTDKNFAEKLSLFDKKFIDTVVDKYEEIKLISNKYNNTFEAIQEALGDILDEFANTKTSISDKIDELSKKIEITANSTNIEIKALNECFENLRSQISNKSFDEAFQASINKQISSLEALVSEQLGYIEDINELCANNLPDVVELNTLVKYSVVDSVNKIIDKLDSDNTEKLLAELKTDVVTQILNIFNQISFVAEQEEIIDFIQDKHDELITILSHIVTTNADIATVKDNVSVVDEKINSLKDDIELLNEKITAFISSDGDIDYFYSLQDLESDIANLRLVLNEMKENEHGQEFKDLIASTNDIYNLVESIKSEFPNKQDFEGIAEDIVSISTRTNKLILASDESYKTLQDNLQDFKLVINDLDERTRNFAQESGMDRIDLKLNALNDMMINGAKTNQVFNQVFEYLAEWVDKASVQINSISDRVETLDDIEQIKTMLAELKAGADDNSESVELVEALSTIFDKQAKRISSLETKLDKIIVETTINNKIDMKPFEETLNRFLVVMDEKMSSQQAKINSLEEKLEGVLNILDEKDTAALTKKVGGMDRQIAKLNKSIEKIASHVVEK